MIIWMPHGNDEKVASDHCDFTKIKGFFDPVLTKLA